MSSIPVNSTLNDSGSLAWRIGFSLLGGLPVAVALYIMTTHWVAVPFWDAWQTPGDQIASCLRGTLTLSELFSQHNEHRPFFQRIVHVPLAAAFGWDVRREMALGFVLLCVGTFGLYLLLRQTTRSPRLALAGAAIMNLLVFAPRQYENLLSGTDGASFLPSLALVFAMVVNLSRQPFATKAMANAALACAATYTFGNGMLLWAFAFPIDTGGADSSEARRQRQRTFWRVAYLAAGAAAIAASFGTYKHPPLAPPPAQRLADIPAILHFVLRWLGAPFLLEPAAAVGLAAVIILAALALWVVTRGVRIADWRLYYPWLALGAFVLLSGFVAARSRLGFGLGMAGDGRYAAFTVFFHVATVGLGFTMGRQIGARSFAATGAAYVLAIVALSIWAFTEQRPKTNAFQQTRRHTEMLVRWSEAIPENPELSLLSPYATTPATIRTLAAHDVLRPRLIAHAVAHAIRTAPAGETVPGVLERVRSTPTGVSVRGWACLPDGRRAADYVVIGYEAADGSWHPWTVVQTGAKRRDVAEGTSNSARLHSGFAREIKTGALPAHAVRFRAWAIDLERGLALAISGTVTATVPPL